MKKWENECIFKHDLATLRSFCYQMSEKDWEVVSVFFDPNIGRYVAWLKREIPKPQEEVSKLQDPVDLSLDDPVDLSLDEPPELELIPER